MIIISDTSVITYLLQLDSISILQALFQKVVIPIAVKEELEKIPSQRSFLERNNWIIPMSIQNLVLFNELSKELDRGEAEAIVLSLELKADILLIDEKKGRKIAKKHGIFITGLLGVLIDAKNQGLLEKVKPLLDKLIYEHEFRLKPKLYRHVLKLVKE
ncbi:MAG: DUF3368 domain-containing protein [Chitinophagales bacterium]